ncbi:hypothetical protein CEY09_02680 [Achromobacter marplatensis]|jgi:hypothetical protein|uniref:SCP2 domain-containing protein n=1 Tax=Achromobacter marplatensis TaxID=470868 RepID=A0ABX9GL30_9BURK|nr:hypothetical protein [Achromobacter marplatensis]OWT72441.1 hypothetical protein CEY09_02680 [Achromobacter marplatensis]RBP24260.1 hypothetical protein DFP87_101770 [Achromobacter marplatensis]CAB3627473.1 hypothetical protein LMG26219_00538 [Achromobacter marplatensis]
MQEDDFILNRLADAVNGQERLVWRGRHLNTVFLLERGGDAYLITVAAGRIQSVRKGPFVMPRWQFALRASAEDWAQFWRPLPPPGFHDLMALVKFRRLRAEGDLYPLMSNLLYFKDVLACPRAEGASS